jgi:hypothetical protein
MKGYIAAIGFFLQGYSYSQILFQIVAIDFYRVGRYRCYTYGLYVRARIDSRSSMLGSGATNDVQYLIWSCHTLAINKSLVASQDTLKLFCKVLSWSLHWLYLGRWPTHDWNGVEYAEGTEEYSRAYDIYWLTAPNLGAVLFSSNCDLDFLHKMWRLENHNNNSKPCTWCGAGLADDCNWRDFRPGAAWLNTIYSNAGWLEAHPNHLSLFELPFIGIWTLNPDWMHCKYIGVDQYFFGSVLKLMVFEILGGEPLDNMTRVWRELSRYFTEHSISNAYRLITINMFNNKDQPKLKGRAAEIRHLGKALLHVFEMFSDNRKTLHKRVRATLKLNIKLEEQLDSNLDWNYKGTEYNDFKKTAHEFLCGYNACRASAAQEGLDLFSITIKSHMLMHSVLRSTWIHPKLCWCFGGEAFMKVIKQLHASCTSGMAIHNVTVKSAGKFLVALHCQFSGASRE